MQAEVLLFIQGQNKSPVSPQPFPRCAIVFLYGVPPIHHPPTDCSCIESFSLLTSNSIMQNIIQGSPRRVETFPRAMLRGKWV